jgi:hypothetical protein
VEFIGCEEEIIKHRHTVFILKYISNLRINQTDTNLEPESILFTDLLENISLIDVSGMDISYLLNMPQLDPIDIRNMLTHSAQ